MIKTFYAVDLRLWRITAEVDDCGARIAGSRPVREELQAHYDGSRTEAEARDRFAACDAILCTDSTRGCDCDQLNNLDPACHAHDCAWRQTLDRTPA